MMIAGPKREFDKELKKNILREYERVVKNKKASVIIVDGSSGEGKTTLAVQIADIINEQDNKGLVKLDYNDHVQLGMGSQEFLNQLPLVCEQGYHVIIYDEAGDFGRRSFMSKVNAILNRVFETYRAFKVIVIICLPNFWKLDKSLFELKLPRFLIHLQGKREQAGYGRFRAFGLKRMLDMLVRMEKTNNKNYVLLNWSHNLHGTTYNIDKERSDKLEKLSTRSKKDYVKAQGIKINGKYSIKEVSQKYGIPFNTVRNQSVSEHLEVEKIKGKRYLNEEQIEYLKKKFWDKSKKRLEEENAKKLKSFGQSV